MSCQDQILQESCQESFIILSRICKQDLKLSVLHDTCQDPCHILTSPWVNARFKGSVLHDTCQGPCHILTGSWV